MIQVNLLPDIKLHYIKARRLQRTVIAASVIVGGAALGLFVLLYVGVAVLQKNKLDSLSKEIVADSKKLEATPDLNKILTIQNQLNSLSGLHDKKIVASRLPIFIQQVTPSKATITNLTIDFTTQKITITGEADSLQTVNTYVDTLKFTNYKVSGAPSEQTPRAFSEVVMASFAKTEKGASYSISFAYDPIIFGIVAKDQDNDSVAAVTQPNAVTLVVPNQVTTRSETEKPTALFQVSTPPQGEQ
jgi:Tfp pilus assembly protein PilN